MEWGIIVVVVLVVMVIAPAIGGAFHTTMHSNKFAELGDISGRPIEEIIAAVGRPTSIDGAVDGVLYQWMNATGFNQSHYAILVDQEGKAVGYTHQSLI